MQETIEEIKKQTLDELIAAVCKYLEPEMSQRVLEVYRECSTSGNYRELRALLQSCYAKCKAKLSKEVQDQIERTVFLSDEAPQSVETQEGGHSMKPVILAIVLLVAIIVVVYIILTRKKPGKTENVGSYIQRSKTKAQPKIVYTEKDRDMLELIHLLATITNKTDKFLSEGSDQP